MLNSLIVMDKTFVDKVYDKEVVSEIKKLSNLVSKPLSRDELLDNLDLLKDVDVIFSGWGAPEISAKFIKHAPNLKIVFYAAGTIKKVVTDAFWENNLRITTANTANAIPVAEFTLASIIFGLKNALALRNKISNTRVYPDPTEKNIYGGFKAKVGLISLGAIAKYTLKLMKPFDYDIYVYDPFISVEEAKALNVKLVDLDTIFSECDVVSLHTPLLDVTRGMIKKEHFLKMKNHTTFINTARGAVVDEEGMIEALKERPDISAYLDVVYPEPPLKDNELYDLENVFLTPHIAGSEGNEVGRMGSLMLEEFKLFLNDEDLNYEVSQAAFEVMA